MKSSLQKYLSLSLLLLFLSPLIGKGVHDSAHKSNFSNGNGVVLQEEAHPCSICDFVPLISGVLAEHSFDFSVSYYTQVQPTFHNDEVISSPAYNFSLRGPPAIF